MDNYALSRDRAVQYFLNFDQEAIIKTWDLPHDEENLYVDFLGRSYGIFRKTGEVTRLWNKTKAEFSEVLSIFDLLCHEGKGRLLSGQLAPVNSLRGAPKAGGVNTSFHTPFAARVDANPEGFRKACASLGGKPLDMGDMAFSFSVFGDLPVVVKFYHSDEDFPASLTLLWDANTLQYMFYETVFYVAGFLLSAIEKRMTQI